MRSGATTASSTSRTRRRSPTPRGWLDSLFNALIDLVAVFVIETLIAPLAVLFLLWQLWLRLAAGLRMPFDRDPKPTFENR